MGSAFPKVRDELVVPENAFDATDQWVPAERVVKDTHNARWFRDELKAIDSRLDLVFVKPGAEAFPVDCRFYIRRKNDLVPDSFFLIQDPDGAYAEPSWRHLERFMQMDSARHPNLWREFQKEKDEKKLRAEKRKQELSEQFQEQLLERLDFMFDGPGIMVSAADKEKIA